MRLTAEKLAEEIRILDGRREKLVVELGVVERKLASFRVVLDVLAHFGPEAFGAVVVDQNSRSSLREDCENVLKEWPRGEALKLKGLAERLGESLETAGISWPGAAPILANLLRSFGWEKFRRRLSAVEVDTCWRRKEDRPDKSGPKPGARPRPHAPTITEELTAECKAVLESTPEGVPVKMADLAQRLEQGLVREGRTVGGSSAKQRLAGVLRENGWEQFRRRTGGGGKELNGWRRKTDTLLSNFRNGGSGKAMHKDAVSLEVALEAQRHRLKGAGIGHVGKRVRTV